MKFHHFCPTWKYLYGYCTSGKMHYWPPLEKILPTSMVFTFCFKSKFLNLLESLDVMPSLKELHRYKPRKHISTATLQNQKSFYLLQDICTCYSL